MDFRAQLNVAFVMLLFVTLALFDRTSSGLKSSLMQTLTQRREATKKRKEHLLYWMTPFILEHFPLILCDTLRLSVFASGHARFRQTNVPLARK